MVIHALRDKDSIKTVDSAFAWLRSSPAREKTKMAAIDKHAGRKRTVPTLRGLAASALMLAIAILIGDLLRPALAAASISLVFLVAVLLSAVSFGFWTGIVAAGFAFLAYNFFFVEPLYTFRVAQAEDLLALGVLLLVGALTGSLAGRMREEADAAKDHAATVELLAKFTSDLASTPSIADIETAIIRHLALASGGGAILLRQTENGLSVCHSLPPGTKLDPDDLQSADKCHRSRAPQMAAAPGWSGSRFSFYPLIVQGAVDCIVGVSSPASEQHAPREPDYAVDAMLKQAVVAIERAGFARKAEEARLRAEREALRSALLSSLSHDLRTPLAAILGSVTSLRQLGDALSPDARDDLLLAIEEETGRLSRYVSNLLHMTRLQTGMDARRDWVDLADVLHGAIARARRTFPERSIVFHQGGRVPLIHSDAALLDQAIFNLIDNAIKFSPSDTSVDIDLSHAERQVSIGVTDRGRGIPASEFESIFEPFYRGTGKGTSGVGVGLGLAICKGIMQALGGAIIVKSPIGGNRGTEMRIMLPINGKRPT